MNPITTKSPSDQQYRTLEYVECRTFEKGQCTKTQIIHYPPKEAHDMYRKVVKKYEVSNINVLVCHRNENHELIKSQFIHVTSQL